MGMTMNPSKKWLADHRKAQEEYQAELLKAIPANTTSWAKVGRFNVWIKVYRIPGRDSLVFFRQPE